MIQLSSARRLSILYIKQPLFFVSINNRQRAVMHCLYEATFAVFIIQLSPTRRLDIVYIKQPLLFLSFNYPQRAV